MVRRCSSRYWAVRLGGLAYHSRMIQLRATPEDAPEFFARVDAVATRIAWLRPRQIYVVRIDNWFGKRWVGFAGKIAGAAGVRFREDLVVPPFVPNRVVDQTCYERSEAGGYVAVGSGAPIHVAQVSTDNLKRKVSMLFPDAALLWFSSNSKTNDRGTILAYVPGSHGHDAWFAGLRGGPDWQPTELVGITAAELRSP
jgi:hypothetical protein